MFLKQAFYRIHRIYLQAPGAQPCSHRRGLATWTWGAKHSWVLVPLHCLCVEESVCFLHWGFVCCYWSSLVLRVHWQCYFCSSAVQISRACLGSKHLKWEGKSNPCLPQVCSGLLAIKLINLRFKTSNNYFFYCDKRKFELTVVYFFLFCRFFLYGFSFSKSMFCQILSVLQQTSSTFWVKKRENWQKRKTHNFIVWYNFYINISVLGSKRLWGCAPCSACPKVSESCDDQCRGSRCSCSEGKQGEVAESVLQFKFGLVW